ncbi:ABC transporter permease [Fulvivirga sediminis]|uniref:ABC transporter permease n=1 Tax=Fulvivirga sediminis TaxID=2803949 RepID=A0A937FCC9_9BACT|nr:ABC transporter permease [Fulvivirga sediminis]MBL3658305.1 ABC transporter permease [Fulvivirga sediminis]
MIKNYFKIAIRNFLRNKFYAGLNILGLSVGVAVALLISVYLLHELSYDNFHVNGSEIYRVNQTNIWDPEGGWMSRTPPPVADAMSAEFPEVEATLRINTPNAAIVNIEHGGAYNSFRETSILAVDSNFFDFFGFKLQEGSPDKALSQMNAVVLSEEAARRFFGDDSALGKTILLGDDKTPVEVTGVAEKQPTNAHIHFDLLLSMPTNPHVKRFEWSWIWTQMYTYVRLKDGVEKVEEGMHGLAHKYALDAFKRLGISMADFESQKGKLDFELQPVEDIHLNASVGGNLEQVSDMTYIYIFGTVAIFIMLLAGINFVNLTTARAANRAKEIGVKKVLGSGRPHLIRQFLLESVMLSSIATLIGLGFAELLRFSMVDYLDLNLSTGIMSDARILGAVVVLPLLLGVLAGLYPAFYLTSFQPARVLKGNVASGAKSAGLRNVLVVFQFSIAIILVASTFVIYKQLKYCETTDLGMNKDHVLVVKEVDKLHDQMNAFKQEMNKVSGVHAAALGSVMGGNTSNALEDLFYREGQSEKKISLATVKGDEDYVPLLDMQLLAGRNFVKSNPSDKSAIIINERAMKAFGWSLDNVLGQKVEYFESVEFHVIGVVSDFNMISVKFQIPPLAIFHTEANLFNDNRLLAVKYDPQRLQEVIASLETNWKLLSESVPLDYVFLDESFAEQYQNDQKLGSLFSVFATLALLIACLGLFGLASFMAAQRNKEIGVRKVLGASVAQIVILLNSNFSKLIIISLFISIPVVWWLMSKWLEQFVIRIDIGWEIYAISGFCAISIAWLTVSYQSIKAAVVDPVKSLKEE